MFELRKGNQKKYDRENYIVRSFIICTALHTVLLGRSDQEECYETNSCIHRGNEEGI
jgi:hypothetical protein